MDEKREQNRLLAFRSLYDSYAASLIRFSSQFVSVEAAEDIVQDVFLDLWKNYGIKNPDSAKTYLFTTVRNKCINHLNRSKVNAKYVDSAKAEIRLLGLDYYDTAEKRIVEKEDLLNILNEINRLPDKCREIFKLAYFEYKKSSEIAAMLGISERTVEHQLYLGLKKLRDSLLKKKGSLMMFNF